VLEVAVLLSIGRHPASGRARHADLDARALQLALSLADVARVHAIHAGDPDEPALRDYLGMGIDSLTVLALDGDVSGALSDHLKLLRPAVVLAGHRAECGEASGMLPYVIAQTLQAQLVADAVSITLRGDSAGVIQAQPRGGRRALRVALPLVVTVDRAAPQPRMSAFGPAQRGQIRTIAVDPLSRALSIPPDWLERPAAPAPCAARPGQCGRTTAQHPGGARWLRGPAHRRRSGAGCAGDLAIPAGAGAGRRLTGARFSVQDAAGGRGGPGIWVIMTCRTSTQTITGRGLRRERGS
jgi:electron transfer flavoprotein beta subunit